MNDFNNWNEVTRGLYRYVIAAKVCYEIHILYHAHDTPIRTAKANLYIVGDWKDKNGFFFERELLLSQQPVDECIKRAVADDKENNG